MLVTTILAVACLVLAFIGEAIDERLFFGTLEWLVAAVAFDTLAIGTSVGGKK